MSSLRIERCIRVRTRFGAIATLLSFFCAAAFAAKVNPLLLDASEHGGRVDALLILPDQRLPSLVPLRPGLGYLAHRRALVDALNARARAQQRDIRAWLDARGIGYRDFWIVNMIEARLNSGELRALAQRGDIARIETNPRIVNALPQTTLQPVAAPTSTIAWGVSQIQAPAVWNEGFTGQGVVVGSEDTGFQWDHPALIDHYRGWNGSSADHNYNWHDAVHVNDNSCGADSLFPCDDYGHGTRTMGVMVGDDGADASPRHQVGAAPGAKWIGCRNMDDGTGTPTRYIECMQWMLAPTDLDGQNPNPDLAPDIINNSWYCPQSEGCTTGEELRQAVDTLVAAGIFYVAAAQNNGPNCETIEGPPATYDASFDVGATDDTDTLASFSSRGPVPTSLLIRPDLVAPGVNVYTTAPTDSYVSNATGTSLATPYVVGAAALLMSAFPALKGQPQEVAQILRETAVQTGVTDPISQACGGIPSKKFPNYALGYGRLDVWKAFVYHDAIFANGFDN